MELLSTPSPGPSGLPSPLRTAVEEGSLQAKGAPGHDFLMVAVADKTIHMGYNNTNTKSLCINEFSAFSAGARRRRRAARRR